MKISRWSLALVWLAGCFAPAWAKDLGTPERTIPREPAYQASPQYCLLVFGSEAQMRVWLVADGSVLYVDRNGNGDLTEPGERVLGQGDRFTVGAITERDGATRHTDLVVRFHDGKADISVKTRGKHLTRANHDGQGDLRFAARRQDAPIIHFNGQLTPYLGPRYPELKPQALVRGLPAEFKDGDDPWKKPNTLVFGLCTPGRGPGTTAWRLGLHHIPDRDIRLAAAIEFPSRRKGGEPVKAHTFIRPFQ
jgi:hypothetical protein